MNPTEDVLTDEDMGMTDEQMGVQGLENFAPIGEKAIAGAAVGADPYQFQKPDVLAGFNNENNQKMAQQNIDGVKAMLYGIPNIGPAIPDALDAVGIGENNQESWSKAAEDYAPVTAMSSIVSPSPVGKMGIAARIGGAGVDAAQRATDQGESPTGWGLAGAAMQGGGELLAKGVGKLATAVAPHVNDAANGILSRFLNMSPESIATLTNGGQMDNFVDALRTGSQPVLQSGGTRQTSFNALANQSGGPAVGKVMNDLRQVMTPGVQGATAGMRQGPTNLVGAAVESAVGQKIQSTAGLAAKDIAQGILNNPKLMQNPNASGLMNGRIMRFLQIVQDSDNPEVEMEIGMQDPELARYMNEVRKDNK